MIEISYIKVSKILRIAELYPNGHIESHANKIFWVYVEEVIK